MKTIALIGAGGHGKVLADIAELSGYTKIVFFDDGWPQKRSVGKWKVVGNTKLLLHNKNNINEYIISIGDNKVRAEKYEFLIANNLPIATLVHPASIVSKYVSIGQGTVIMAGAVININTVIGVSCVVNTGAIVDHDCCLKDFSHISPGASLAGNVKVGMQSWVGIGSSVKQGVCISDHSVIGAGAAVVSDIRKGAVAVGVPAKII